MGESLRSLAYGFQISHCITKQTVWELLQLVCEMKMPLYLPSPSKHDLTRNSWVLGKLAFPQLCGSNRGREHVHTLCARNVAPPFSYTRIASWLIPETHIYCDTHLFFWKWADSGIFSKPTMRKNIYFRNFGLWEHTELTSSENSWLTFSLETMYVFMSYQQIVGKNHNIKIANKNAKIAAYFKHLRRALTIKNVYLNINQLDALNFIMSLFHASTCFEHMSSSSGRQNCTIQPLVSSHL